MKIAAKALFLVTISFIIGCANTRNTPIDSMVIVKSNPQKITVTKREKPGFQAWSSTYVHIPFIGIVAIYHEGDKLVKENGVDNPADNIGQEIARLLANKYNIETIETSDKKMISWDAEDIIRHHPEGGLIVDVQTIKWGYGYFFKGNYGKGEYKYRIFYDAKLRIMDSHSKNKIAEGNCYILPQDEDHIFTRDQLTENSAQVLKDELELATDDCLRQFNEKVIHIDKQ